MQQPLGHLAMSRLLHAYDAVEAFHKTARSAGVAEDGSDRLHGSFSGVVGLPLYETAELLRAAGVPNRRIHSESFVF